LHSSRHDPIEPAAPDWPERYARAALENITRVYPNAPALLLRGPEDLRPPEEVHPAFFGSFDWHSSVHMHWSLIRLLRWYPDLASAEDLRRGLARNLTSDALDRESEYLASFPTFERPYGWGWALALVTEAHSWRAADEVVSLVALRAMGKQIVHLLRRYLEVSHYPNRSGTHGNSAFALILALEFARTMEEAGMESSIVAAAMRWYGKDRDAPILFEPSGEDFLSPTLCEAHLMSRVLPEKEFSTWLDGFLPGFSQRVPSSLGSLPRVGDAKDGRIAHLLGLMLSRAWSLTGLAAALPANDPRRSAAVAAASDLASAGLQNTLSGNYETDHWLISFALLAMEGFRLLAAPEVGGHDHVEQG
jgi:hypothetical protein